MSSYQQRKTRLGDLLVERGYIAQDQLLQAIEEQKHSDLQLGELLVQHGWVSHRQIRKALRVQSKLRNAILTSILSFSPLVLVGCGGAAESASSESAVAASQALKNDNKPDKALKSKGNTKHQTSNVDDSSTSSSGTTNTNIEETESTTSSDPTSSSEITENTDSAESSTTEGAESIINADPGATIHLSWNYPTARTNGSNLEVFEIDSFRVYQLDEHGGVGAVHIVDGLDTEYDIAGLADGEYHFAVTVVDSDGLESDYSDVVTVSVL